MSSLGAGLFSKFRYLLFFVICAFSDFVIAQDELGLENESISAVTGQSTPTAVAPVVASIITREDIDRYGYRSLSEALSHVPGFHLTRLDLLGVPLFGVRGFISGFTLLVLIDNRPLTTSLYGNKDVDVARLPMQMIERIEILRGPSSSVYGVEAFLGVINIVTRKKIENHSVTLSTGTFDTHTLSAVGGGKVSNMDFAFGLNIVDTNGNDPLIEQDFQSLLDGQFGTDASLTPGRARYGETVLYLNSTLSDDNTLLSASAGVLVNKELGVGFLPVLDDQGEIDLTNFSVSGEEQFFKSVNTRLTASVSLDQRQWSLDDVQYYPEDAFGGQFPDGVVSSVKHTEQYLNSRISGNYLGLHRQEITFAAAYEHSRARVTDLDANHQIDENGLVLPGESTDPSFDKASRDVLSLKANDEILLNESIRLSVGFNAEIHSEYKNRIGPRLGLIWTASPVLTTKFLVGQGIRFPAYFETLNIGIPGFIANPDLEPEAIISYDIGLEYRLSPRASLQLNAFYHETDDLIAYLTDPQTGSLVPDNFGYQRGRGIEFEAKYRPKSNIELSAFGYAQENWLSNDFGQEGVDDSPTFLPRIKVGLKGSFRRGPYRGGATITYSGDRDNRLDGEDPQRYTIVDLSATYDLNQYISMALKIENAFDTDAEEPNIGTSIPYGLELPGRGVYASVTGRWP